MAHPVPSGASPANTFAAGLFADLGPQYDRLAEVLSFGQNGRWRRELVSHIVASKPHRVLSLIHI